jgi:UDP-galactopyranose mutase
LHPDLICFSHLRWDFVFQRPNHLMSRAARDRRVLYVEEPLHEPGSAPRMDSRWTDGVVVITPHLPAGLDEETQGALLRELLDAHLDAAGVEDPVLWYYTPMALPWSDHLDAAAVVYDCMDHLAGFRGAPAGLLAQEARLIARADLLFTGGARLHGLKRQDHANAHCFPSSVDAGHFRAARRPLAEPPDQAPIPGPRVGYAGVIDERLDLSLVGSLADAHPEWSVVLVGPVAKIDPAEIPAMPNVHHLGLKSYTQLPGYLSGWDLAIMPFAHNEATAYISPTKTPEYLAAGLPVASTSIHDVVVPYGREGMVQIGDGPDGFLGACRRAVATDRSALMAQVDAWLARSSWDETWLGMDALLDRAIQSRSSVPALPASRTRFLLPAPSRAMAGGGAMPASEVVPVAPALASDATRPVLVPRALPRSAASPDGGGIAVGPGRPGTRPAAGVLSASQRGGEVSIEATTMGAVD